MLTWRWLYFQAFYSQNFYRNQVVAPCKHKIEVPKFPYNTDQDKTVMQNIVFEYEDKTNSLQIILLEIPLQQLV